MERPWVWLHKGSPASCSATNAQTNTGGGHCSDQTRVPAGVAAANRLFMRDAGMETASRHNVNSLTATLASVSENVHGKNILPHVRVLRDNYRTVQICISPPCSSPDETATFKKRQRVFSQKGLEIKNLFHKSVLIRQAAKTHYQ